MRTIPAREYIKLAQLVTCVTSQQFREWFTGSDGRHERTERVLRRLVSKGKLKSVKLGVTKIYYAPKYERIGNVEHGLGVTEGLVRFWRSDMSMEILPSRSFRGLGNVPDFAFRLGGNSFYYEFTTWSNFYGRLRRKIKQYEENLPNIEKQFGKGYVIFVCDVRRDSVKHYQPKPDWAIFTDYETFKSVPIGSQLTARIYFYQDREIALREPVI